MNGVPTMRNGWLKLWYKIEDNPLFTNANVLAVFVKILVSATRTDTVLVDGTQLTRGQAVISQRTFAKGLEISHKAVRTALKRLENLGVIKVAQVRAHGPSIVTICNYCSYQDKYVSPGTDEGTVGAQEGHSKGTVGALLEDSKKEEGKKVRTKEPPKSPTGDSVDRNGHFGDDLMALWNSRVAELADPRLKPIKAITAERRKHINQRRGDADWFNYYLEALNHLPFHNHGSFVFQPTFDWLIKNSTNAIKTAEGAYDERRPIHKQILLPITDGSDQC